MYPLSLALFNFPSASMETRDWRPDPKNSDRLFCELEGKGTELNGVLTSAASPRCRHTDSAARKPPGVMVIPL
jgi:hypothetical protein